MRERGLCCQVVSVTPSVCHIGGLDCIHTAEDIVKLLYRPGSPIILVFVPERRYRIPRGTLQRGDKYKGRGKICDFQLKSLFVLETVRDRLMVIMER